MTPEGRVKNMILSYLKLRYRRVTAWVNDSVGIWDQKAQAYRANRSPYRIKGVADILGVVAPNGRLLAIEVKVPETRSPDGKRILRRKGMPSPEQVAFIEMVNRMGGIAFVARSIKDIDEHLAEYRTNGHGNPIKAAVKPVEIDPNQTDLEDFLTPESQKRKEVDQ